MKIYIYHTILFFLASTSHMLAEMESSLQLIDEKIKSCLIYITEKEKEEKQKEKDRYEEDVLTDRIGLVSMYNATKDIETYREKPSEEYIKISNKEKHNNLIQVMAGFIKGEEKKNKLIDINAVSSLELLKKGNFIDKLCYHFDLDKLAEDKKILGEEEATRRYSEDMSLDKLYFLYKLLNYEKDIHSIVENKEILELFEEDPDTLEELFLNLREMKSAQEFLLLFNDQISFLNQCGFADLEYNDCLESFSYNDTETQKKILEYGQDTSHRKYENINFLENRYKRVKVDVWTPIDYINPFHYICYLYKSSRLIHNLFEVLHLKHLLFGLFLSSIVWIIKKNISTGDAALPEIIYHITLFTTIFDFILNFTSISSPILFALLAGIVSSLIREGVEALFFIFFTLLKGLIITSHFDIESLTNKVDNMFIKPGQENGNINNINNINNNNEQGDDIQQQNDDNNVQPHNNQAVAHLSIGALFVGIYKGCKSLLNTPIRNDSSLTVGKSLMIIFFTALASYAIYKFVSIPANYNRALHLHLCNKINKKTLNNARKFIGNMHSFYNTLKSNPYLYKKLKKKLKSCYLLFDEEGNKRLTKKQKAILEILNEGEDEITDYEIVQFFCFFDEKEKQLFKKAISEIYDVSTYINSAHLVSTGRYCIAQFINRDSNYILMKSMLHPYLTEGIKNNVELGETSKYKHRNLLFTGSNRSGKTTFIAALALNVLLAHVFGIAFCDTCILTPFDKIITIFNYETDINDQQSKFSNEIKVLRSLLEYLNNNRDLKILFASDEQFSSTDPETANYLMSCFLASIYKQKNITSLNSTHLALPRQLAVLFQDELRVCNVSLKTTIEKNGTINFKRKLINCNGKMIGEQLARNMGFFDQLDLSFVNTLKDLKYKQYDIVKKIIKGYL